VKSVLDGPVIAAERLAIHGERLVGTHEVLVEPTMDHCLERRYIEPGEHSKEGRMTRRPVRAKVEFQQPCTYSYLLFKP
jgi:hypothetical protein